MTESRGNDLTVPAKDLIAFSAIADDTPYSGLGPNADVDEAFLNFFDEQQKSLSICRMVRAITAILIGLTTASGPSSPRR